MTRRLMVSMFGAVCLLSGCLVAPPPGEVVVVRRPPPDRVEVVTDRPGPDYIWIRGYWAWGGNDYTWIGGRWDRPVRPTGDDARRDDDRGRSHGNPHDNGRRRTKWKDGHWTHYRGGWVWQPGAWQQ
ncbi:MAG TPA: YXWGXW repeat-containing protein [Gemmatimonadales bacterium]|nr:YXWGXW repeat-containing protein [Gemmatimonadales bacterium]